MSSTKSSTGHLLGASGAIEAIFSIISLKRVFCPDFKLDNPSDGCKDINLIPHQSIDFKSSFILSNSFGFGGTNVSLIFKNL